jgi:Domain of unknown function (DUF4124)
MVKIAWCSILILLISFTWACPIPAEIYKWTDEKGVLVFSDTPPPNNTENVRMHETDDTTDSPDCAAYTGDKLVSLTHLSVQQESQILLNIEKMLLKLYKEMKLPERRRIAIDSISAYELIQENKSIKFAHEKQKVFLINGDVHISNCHNSVVIAAGNIDISNGSNNILISGKSVKVSHDRGNSIIVAKSSVKISFAINTTIYAPGGLKISHPSNVIAYNTESRKISSGHVNNFLIDPLFRVEQPFNKANSADAKSSAANKKIKMGSDRINLLENALSDDLKDVRISPFKAYYYTENDGKNSGKGNDGTIKDIVSKLQFTETVKRPSINFIYSDFNGINSYNFYGVWKGVISATGKGQSVKAQFDVSKGDVSLYVNDDLVEKWRDDSKIVQFNLNKVSA